MREERRGLFSRKPVAKAFSGLKFSSAERLKAHQVPIPPPRDPLPFRSIIIINKAPQPGKIINFFAMPTEIRLRVCSLLLVSRFCHKRNPNWAVEDSNPNKMVKLSKSPAAAPHKIRGAAILQTCKRVYEEANSILYSQNIFYICHPKEMFRFIAQIGPINVRLVKSINMWVPWMAEVDPWVNLFTVLAKEASGLRAIGLTWEKCDYCDRQYMRGAPERGLGDNVQFVRALAQIQGLQRLTIEGYYAKRWPAYLEESMGVQVQAERGYTRYYEFNSTNLTDEEVTDEELKRKLKEKEWVSFKMYQLATGDLTP